jgi:ankyrin repeat protein
VADPKHNIADLCGAAADGDCDRIPRILEAAPELVNVCVAENNEHRPLHFAVMGQHEEAVRLPVGLGAKVDAGIYPHRDATGPLTIAEERGLDTIVQIIREEEEKLQLAACENITISTENDALFNAVQVGNDTEACRLLKAHPELLNACQRSGGSVLYAAACAGRYAMVAELLSRGADFNHLTPQGASPP